MDDDFPYPHLDAEDSPEYRQHEAEMLLAHALTKYPELKDVHTAALLQVFIDGVTYARREESF